MTHNPDNGDFTHDSSTPPPFDSSGTPVPPTAASDPSNVSAAGEQTGPSVQPASFGQPASSAQQTAPAATSYLPPQSSPFATNKKKTSGLAIASLVLGVLAFLGSWIPVLNIGAIILAIIGLILGIVALVKISRQSINGKPFGIAGIVLAVIAIIASIGMNILAIKGFNDALNDSEFQQMLEQAESDIESGSDSFANDDLTDDADAPVETQELSIGETATLKNGLEVTISEPETVQDELEREFIRVTVTYKNGGDKPAEINPYYWAGSTEQGVSERAEYPLIDDDSDRFSDALTLKTGGTYTGHIYFKPETAFAETFEDYEQQDAGTPAATWALNDAV